MRSRLHRWVIDRWGPDAPDLRPYEVAEITLSQWKHDDRKLKMLTTMRSAPAALTVVEIVAATGLHVDFVLRYLAEAAETGVVVELDTEGGVRRYGCRSDRRHYVELFHGPAPEAWYDDPDRQEA